MLTNTPCFFFSSEAMQYKYNTPQKEKQEFKWQLQSQFLWMTTNLELEYGGAKWLGIEIVAYKP